VLCPVPGRRPNHRRLRRGFTLIELVTAAALMTIMMLGVIQIFATITTAAGDAQGFQFAQEQSRALLDTMKRDLRGLTREGYLRIVTGSTGNYTSDLLAFTTVGSASSCWGTQPYTAGAYEAVYTTHVKTPDNERVVKIGTRPINVDQRRGILGRGVWLMGGKANGMGLDTEDASKNSPWLADMEANITANPTNYRRSLDTMQIWPLTNADGFSGYSTNAPSLRRVLASCCSEFRVEYLIYSPSDNDFKWYHDLRDIVAGQRGGSSLRLFPRAIRVTVAIHDPDDRKPWTGTGTEWFKGYASQEVFWISDP
jgi:prepilin-type N-terminal cleavage/methylation domain-containing protein